MGAWQVTQVWQQTNSERKVREWIKDAMIPHVVPLLQLTYQAAATTEEQKKVDKVINIWDDKRFFNKPIMHWIRQSTSSIASTESAAAAAAPLTSFPAPWQQQQQSPITSNSSNFASTSNNIRNEYAAVPTQPSRRSIPAGPSIRPRPPSPATPSTPPKQYFELPVGCMIPAIEVKYLTEGLREPKFSSLYSCGIISKIIRQAARHMRLSRFLKCALPHG